MCKRISPISSLFNFAPLIPTSCYDVRLLGLICAIYLDGFYIYVISEVISSTATLANGF